MGEKMQQRGFTLVELSIVLIIIGLLAGGIIAGKSLIQSARLQAVVAEHARYSNAVRMFQDTYDGYPGDLYNAVDIWGAKGTGTACYTVIATDKRTCNGDGNLLIFDTTRHEYFLFWQHLANAGLIDGQFTAVAGSGGSSHFIPGENSPKSKYTGAGWSMAHYKVFAGNTYKWESPTQVGHTLVVGAQNESDFTTNPIFTVQEVYKLDKKMDDGMPGLGKLQVLWYRNCTNATSATQWQTATYALQNEQNNQCAMFFPGTIAPRVPQ